MDNISFKILSVIIENQHFCYKLWHNKYELTFKLNFSRKYLIKTLTLTLLKLFTLF